MILYFLPMILLIGFVTSYEDIREGKIRNRYIILASGYSILVYSFLMTKNYLIGGLINRQYLVELITNSLISLIIGFIIWYIGLWTAGDAKLFFAYSVILPLTVYSQSYMNYFPSFNLLVNTFMPIFIVFLFILIIKSDWKQKKYFLKKFFQPKKLLALVFSLFSIWWLLGLLYAKVNALVIIALAVLVYYGIKKIFKKYFIYPFIIVSVIRIFFDKSIYTMGFLKNFILVFVIWAIINSIIESKFLFFIKEVKIKNLKKGMIPAGNQYKPEFKAEGISGKEIKKIKKENKRGGFVSKIKIKQTLPFAPFMFAGALLTLIIKGNILILVKNPLLIANGFSVYILFLLACILPAILVFLICFKVFKKQ